MTRELVAEEVAGRIAESLPGVVLEHEANDVWVEPDSILEVAGFLRDDPDLDFAFLTAISAVDYVEYFEMVYHLVSMRRNHRIVVKSRVFGREEPSVPSVTDIWQGADLQEREVWDLMGIRFNGHPNMKRVLLWEGFPGHPLRKDFLG
jgi:NADH-quinone oxidoreductase subunit C